MNQKYTDKFIPQIQKIDNKAIDKFFDSFDSLDINKIEESIKDENIPINSINSNGETAINKIITSSQSEDNILTVIKYLYFNGVDLDKPNKYNITPFLKCCQYQYINIISYLIDKKCNVNNTDYVNRNAYYYLINNIKTDKITDTRQSYNFNEIYTNNSKDNDNILFDFNDNVIQIIQKLKESNVSFTVTDKYNKNILYLIIEKFKNIHELVYFNELIEINYSITDIAEYATICLHNHSDKLSITPTTTYFELIKKLCDPIIYKCINKNQLDDCFNIMFYRIAFNVLKKYILNNAADIDWKSDDNHTIDHSNILVEYFTLPQFKQLNTHIITANQLKLQNFSKIFEDYFTYKTTYVIDYIKNCYKESVDNSLDLCIVNFAYKYLYSKSGLKIDPDSKSSFVELLAAFMKFENDGDLTPYAKLIMPGSEFSNTINVHVINKILCLAHIMILDTGIGEYTIIFNQLISHLYGTEDIEHYVTKFKEYTQLYNMCTRQNFIEYKKLDVSSILKVVSNILYNESRHLSTTIFNAIISDESDNIMTMSEITIKNIYFNIKIIQIIYNLYISTGNDESERDQIKITYENIIAELTMYLTEAKIYNFIIYIISEISKDMDKKKITLNNDTFNCIINIKREYIVLLKYIYKTKFLILAENNFSADKYFKLITLENKIVHKDYLDHMIYITANTKDIITLAKKVAFFEIIKIRAKKAVKKATQQFEKTQDPLIQIKKNIALQNEKDALIKAAVAINETRLLYDSVNILSNLHHGVTVDLDYDVGNYITSVYLDLEQILDPVDSFLKETEEEGDEEEDEDDEDDEEYNENDEEYKTDYTDKPDDYIATNFNKYILRHPMIKKTLSRISDIGVYMFNQKNINTIAFIKSSCTNIIKLIDDQSYQEPDTSLTYNNEIECISNKLLCIGLIIVYESEIKIFINYIKSHLYSYNYDYIIELIKVDKSQKIINLVNIIYYYLSYNININLNLLSIINELLCYKSVEIQHLSYDQDILDKTILIIINIIRYLNYDTAPCKLNQILHSKEETRMYPILCLLGDSTDSSNKITKFILHKLGIKRDSVLTTYPSKEYKDIVDTNFLEKPVKNQKNILFLKNGHHQNIGVFCQRNELIGALTENNNIHSKIENNENTITVIKDKLNILYARIKEEIYHLFDYIITYIIKLEVVSIPDDFAQHFDLSLDNLDTKSIKTLIIYFLDIIENIENVLKELNDSIQLDLKTTFLGLINIEIYFGDNGILATKAQLKKEKKMLRYNTQLADDFNEKRRLHKEDLEKIKSEYTNKINKNKLGQNIYGYKPSTTLEKDLEMIKSREYKQEFYEHGQTLSFFGIKIGYIETSTDGITSLNLNYLYPPQKYIVKNNKIHKIHDTSKKPIIDISIKDNILSVNKIKQGFIHIDSVYINECITLTLDEPKEQSIDKLETICQLGNSLLKEFIKKLTKQAKLFSDINTYNSYYTDPKNHISHVIIYCSYERGALIKKWERTDTEDKGEILHNPDTNKWYFVKEPDEDHPNPAVLVITTHSAYRYIGLNQAGLQLNVNNGVLSDIFRYVDLGTFNKVYIGDPSDQEINLHGNIKWCIKRCPLSLENKIETRDLLLGGLPIGVDISFDYFSFNIILISNKIFYYEEGINGDAIYPYDKKIVDGYYGGGEQTPIGSVVKNTIYFDCNVFNYYKLKKFNTTPIQHSEIDNINNENENEIKNYYKEKLPSFKNNELYTKFSMTLLMDNKIVINDSLNNYENIIEAAEKIILKEKYKHAYLNIIKDDDDKLQKLKEKLNDKYIFQYIQIIYDLLIYLINKGDIIDVNKKEKIWNVAETFFASFLDMDINKHKKNALDAFSELDVNEKAIMLNNLLTLPKISELNKTINQALNKVLKLLNLSDNYKLLEYFYYYESILKNEDAVYEQIHIINASKISVLNKSDYTQICKNNKINIKKFCLEYHQNTEDDDNFGNTLNRSVNEIMEKNILIDNIFKYFINYIELHKMTKLTSYSEIKD